MSLHYASLKRTVIGPVALRCRKTRRHDVRYTLGVVTAALALVAVPAATAHNIAHHFLPDGTCVEVGSGNSPADQAVFQVDKIPSTVPVQDASGEWIRDEFGTRWVADA